jgi:hypothetical protein
MTTLVLLALAWAFLALTTAFVLGHGIRLADRCIPAGSCADDAPSTGHALPPAIAA